MDTIQLPTEGELNSDEKLRELVVHISDRSQSDRPFGATKLNKLLFFIDFLHYRMYGTSITSAEYQKLDHGPCPRRIMPVIRSLKESGAIDEHESEFFGRKQRRIVPKRHANLSLFTSKEIDFIDTLIADAFNRTATDLSNMSHDFVGWQLAENGETIPYQVALVSRRAPTQGEIAHGMQLESVAQEVLKRAG